jgi:hypothetical protein
LQIPPNLPHLFQLNSPAPAMVAAPFSSLASIYTLLLRRELILQDPWDIGFRDAGGEPSKLGALPLYTWRALQFVQRTGMIFTGN